MAKHDKGPAARSRSSGTGRFRIIGGSWRSRRLPVPADAEVRPTPDRVRETVFNWLAPVIEGARCLDLYAGSGALGLEALSRGAAEVTFVDRAPAVRRHIEDCLRLLDCDRGVTVCRDALAYLGGAPARFDIVFVDPPYRLGLAGPVMARLVAGGPGRPEGFNRGYYVRPTVFADVTNDMTIARQEIFGPVLSIIPFDSEEEAVAIANDTIYGLTNYVQTSDGARRNRLARQLRAGMVEMNGQGRGRGSAFGGVKASGRAREGGVWGLEEFMDSKQISGWDPDA